MSFDRAKKSIQIATQKFDRGDLYRALQKALNRGIKVTLVLPASELQPTNKKRACKSLIMKASFFDECLIEQGADVRYILSSSTLPVIGGHTIIVDEAYGFRGSFEFSWNSELSSLSHMQVLRGDAAHTASLNLKRLHRMNTELIPGLAMRVIKGKDILLLKRKWRKNTCGNLFAE